MAQYTIELGALIESGFDIWDYPEKFPIFDESYRVPLQKYIENMFYDNEIGFETGELFRKNLNRSMIAIMPYYNQLLEANTLTLGPDILVSRHESVKDTHTIKNDETSNVDRHENTNGSVSRTDNLSSKTEHNTEVAVDSHSSKTNGTKRQDNLSDKSESSGSTDVTTSGSSTNSDNEFSIPVSKGSEEPDPQYMSGATRTKGSDDSTSGTTTQDTTTVTHEGTQDITETGEATGTDTTTTSGDDTVTNTGTQEHSEEKDVSGNESRVTNGTTVDDYVHELTANDVPKFELLMRLRQTFININQMICEDYAIWNCFMHIL